MTGKTVQILTAVIVGLVLLLFVLRGNDDYEAPSSGQALLPDFKAVANDITEIAISRRDESQIVTAHRMDDKWGISTRDGYPADVGALRQLIVALANAEIVEDKTSNPDHYEKLGVGAPEEGGTGTKVTVKAGELSHALILGNVAQGDYRYARLAGEASSYLINQNPELPQAPVDWLNPDIVDIDSTQVRRVVISHADGETITVAKTDREQTDFDVSGIPEGRELSYATVGNGIAGALGKLELDDVRARIEADATTTAVFETWDGLNVSVEVVSDDDTSWIALTAELVDGDSTVSERVTEINERVSGWQYTLADYKKNLLTRRWEDILKGVDED